MILFDFIDSVIGFTCFYVSAYRRTAPQANLLGGRDRWADDQPAWRLAQPTSHRSQSVENALHTDVLGSVWHYLRLRA